MGKYRTIVIDPPWPGPGGVWRPTKVSPRSVLPYATMSGVQIAALGVSGLAADDSQIFLWATTRHVGDAFLLMGLWRFGYRGMFLWKKPLGMGRHMRHELEFLLWGGRPGAQLVAPRECPHQIKEWPKPKRHSEKPAQAYEMIARLSPEPRIDIFARQARPGFEAWGNEVPEIV